MTREIKFRAKIVMDIEPLAMKKGYWVEGHYYEDLQDGEWCSWIQECNDITHYKVDKSTLGQFTGLFDKNENEIYEGDIVRVKQIGGYGMQYIGVVRYYDKDCCFGIDTTNPCLFTKRLLFTDGECSFNDGHCTIVYTNTYEVIGNIHDMTWIKIDRDESGFATEECLDKMFSSLPIVVAQKRSSESILYESICELNDVYAWRGEIDRDADYIYYLPIPKLEV